MPSTRCKFTCVSITLSRTKVPNPEVLEALGEPHPNYVALTAKAEKMGVDAYVQFDRPTVVLTPVMDGSDENKRFWNATPTGKIELGIDNPDGAEVFELAKSYYVDFSPAE